MGKVPTRSAVAEAVLREHGIDPMRFFSAAEDRQQPFHAKGVQNLLPRRAASMHDGSRVVYARRNPAIVRARRVESP